MWDNSNPMHAAVHGAFDVPKDDRYSGRLSSVKLRLGLELCYHSYYPYPGLNRTKS